MPPPVNRAVRSRAASVEILEGPAAQQAANDAAKEKRVRQLMMHRARSSRYYQRKKLEEILV